MLNQDYTSKLLNLEDVIITNAENISNQLHISIELPRRKHTCPCCGTVTDRVHDYRMQVIKDVPLARDTFLHLRKRRYRCDCGKRFFEINTFLPRYYRVTTRLVTEIMFAFKKTVSAKEIGCRYNVSSVTAMRYFNQFNQRLTMLPEVISLDEFKGNSGKYKYQVALLDGETHKIVDIIECRHKHFLCNYFKKFPKEQLDNVKYLVTDLWEPYKDIGITYFRKAKIVADHFHWARYACNALDKIRIEVQSNLPKSERKYFKRSRSLLLSRRYKIKEEYYDELENMLINYSENLRIAYREKEYLLDIIHSSDSAEIKKEQFTEWVKRNLESSVPQLVECAKTYQHWAYEIKNSLEVPYSNGPIEGINNKIKALKRTTFGMTKFENFKARIMLLN